MGDQHQRRPVLGLRGKEGAKAGDPGVPLIGSGVKGVQRRHGFYRTKPEQARRFQATAPLAGIHAGALYAGLCQPAAERAGLLATNGIEIALGCAIIDPEAGRVTRTRGIRMAQHEQAPRFGKFARRKRRRHGGDGGQSQSKAREAMPHPHVGSGSA